MLAQGCLEAAVIDTPRYPPIITTDNCQPRVHAMPDGTLVILVGFEGMCNNCGATVPLHILGAAGGKLAAHFDKPSGTYRQIVLTYPPRCPECGELVPFANLPCGEELPELFAQAQAQAQAQEGPSPLEKALPALAWYEAFKALELSGLEQQYLETHAECVRRVCQAFGLSPREVMVGMDIGMLWRDDDKKRPLKEKIMGALGFYRQKYHQDATDVHVHPSALADGQPDVPARVHADPHIQPHEFWLGVENKVKVDPEAHDAPR